MELDALPVDCIYEILWRTPPGDVLGLSVLPKTFSSAAECDFTWDRFIPADIHSIISRADLEAGLLVNSPPKKDLYLALSDHPILIDQRTRSFQLDRKSGKKCYMLGPGALAIGWGDAPEHWNWMVMENSRFPEVASLTLAPWLEIHGMIRANVLSPNTQYAAYLVFNMTNPRGFATCLVELSIDILGGERSTRMACLHPNSEEGMVVLELPRVRNDGWFEIEMGEFNSGREVQLSVVKTDDHHCNIGLFVDGIEVRPKEGN